jgi:hypothetical protein
LESVRFSSVLSLCASRPELDFAAVTVEDGLNPWAVNGPGTLGDALACVDIATIRVVIATNAVRALQDRPKLVIRDSHYWQATPHFEVGAQQRSKLVIS